MLRPIVTGMLVSIERRGLVQVIPEAAINLWKKWQLRSLIILSLFLQIALILLGKVRKRNGKPLLRFTVWSTYLMADWVATLALGVISNNLQANPNKITRLEDSLVSFWAPFLLLHLGGPDTISAYSLEDNQLWQRRLLELLFQIIMVIYILLVCWSGISSLSVLTIPMFVAGVIKFCERVYSLRSASTEQFRLSLMTDPDPGPSYSKFMEEFTLKKAEGFYVRADEVTEAPLPTYVCSSFGNDELVLKAYHLFRTFKRLFVDLILSFQDRDDSRSFFQSLGFEKAFKLIEVELGFAFDVFYTKAPMVYNPKGYLLRLITFSATLSSLMAFNFMSKKGRYHTIDLAITYLLLVVAIGLEVHAHFILLSSDWTKHWLKKHHPSSHSSLLKHLFRAPRKRWSNLVAQYSVLDVCIEEKPPIFPWILKFFMADNMLDNLRYITYSELSPCLKKLIFEHFREISQSGSKSDLTALCTSRGKRILEKFDCSDLNWSITEVEFDQSVLLWHIATELCYYSDADGENSDERTESKHMSDYMLYLMVMCPFMLPIGIGMIRFRDTKAEALEFFKERGERPDRAQACKMLLRVNTEIPPAKVKGDRSKSVLFDACRVATELRAKGFKVKWEIISEVWVEILAYAACHCRGTHHAQQLRKGGELLTHVWLLMAHLGITEQFQIQQGHARAKLSAK